MNTKPLRRLWQLAFSDSEEFIDLFFSTAFAPERCCFLTAGEDVTAALYWLDCRYREQKFAYIYAVATHPDHRGKGLCRALMVQTHEILRSQNYAGAILYPAEPGLRSMYKKLGYLPCSTVSEFSCEAGTAAALRAVSPEEYARLRRRFLPETGLVQEGASLAYLAAYCGLYAGEDFLLAGAGYDGSFHAMELLGNRDAAPGILAALGQKTGRFRCPGGEIPFTMYCPLRPNIAAPNYVGLVFD